MRFEKLDNRNLRAKQDLRRLLIEEMELGRLRILDLCAGEGHVWRKLRDEYQTESYTPVDQASRQSGQIKFKVDARFVAGLTLSRYNVIDVDTYGEPWAIWQAIAARLMYPTAVFLTRGLAGPTGAGRGISKVLTSGMGIPAAWQPVLPVNHELNSFGDRCQLFISQRTRIVKAYMVEERAAVYYALHCVAIS